MNTKQVCALLEEGQIDAFKHEFAQQPHLFDEPMMLWGAGQSTMALQIMQDEHTTLDLLQFCTSHGAHVTKIQTQHLNNYKAQHDCLAEYISNECEDKNDAMILFLITIIVKQGLINRADMSYETNSKKICNHTYLHKSIECQNEKVMKWLLYYGADPTIAFVETYCDNDKTCGKTALQMCPTLLTWIMHYGAQMLTTVVFVDVVLEIK